MPPSSSPPPRLTSRWWKVSTFAALGAAVYFAVRPAGVGSAVSAGVGKPGQTAAAPHANIWSWLSGSSASAHEVSTPHTGTHLQALRDARNPTEECEALRVLGAEATTDGEAVGEITERTGAQHSRNTRLCAIDALEHVPTAAAKSFLAELLDDQDTTVRSTAMRALAAKARDDADARSSLVAAAHSEDREVRLAALVALGDAHVPEASALIQDALAHETGEMQARLIAALGETHDPAAVASIQTALEGGSQRTREAAIEALGAIGDAASLGVLEDKLAHGSSSDMTAAAEALAETGNATAQQALIDATKTGPHDEQLAALRALSHVDGENVRPVMIGSLTDHDPQAVAVASSWFARHGDRTAVPELASLLKTAPTQAHENIIAALSSIGGDDARAAIAEVARTAGPDEGSALVTLASMPGGADEGRKLALRMVKEGGQNVYSALNLLAQDGSAEARTALIDVARGGGENFAAAMNALGERGDAESVRALRDLTQGGKTSRVRSQAIAALGSVGDSGNTALLTTAAADKSPEVRRAAVMALARRGGDPGAERTIIDATRDTDASIRDTAVRELGLLHTRTAEAQLEKLVAADDADIARTAFHTLASYAPDRAAAVADGAMSHASPEVRAAIVQNASELPAETAKRILDSALHDTSEDVATTAVSTLATIGGPDAQQTLLDLLTSSATDGVKRAAADMLERSATQLTQDHAGLIDRYKSPSDEVDGNDDSLDQDED